MHPQRGSGNHCRGHRRDGSSERAVIYPADFRIMGGTIQVILSVPALPGMDEDRALSAGWVVVLFLPNSTSKPWLLTFRVLQFSIPMRSRGSKAASTAPPRYPRSAPLGDGGLTCLLHYGNRSDFEAAPGQPGVRGLRHSMVPIVPHPLAHGASWVGVRPGGRNRKPTRQWLLAATCVLAL